MRPIPGVPPSRARELTRAEDRLSFLYLEHCVLGRDSNAVTATDEKGVTHIPSASLGVLLLGPGTSVSHQAMVLLADSGASVVWVGEQGVRYYAHGRSLARSSRLLEAQARAVSNRNSRLAVARQMYAMRFADEDVSGLTMQQLRGREGARVRSIYRASSSETGIAWRKRDYDPENFDNSDEINMALSSAHACLYGIVHAVIVALGCSPGLGFVHSGHSLSFVYDVADLYKAEVTIPIAFRSVQEFRQDDEADDIGAFTRRRVRDAVRDGRILPRCAADIRRLLLPDQGIDNDQTDQEDAVVLRLWDEAVGEVEAGVNYSWPTSDEDADL